MNKKSNILMGAMLLTMATTSLVAANDTLTAAELANSVGTKQTVAQLADSFTAADIATCDSLKAFKDRTAVPVTKETLQINQLSDVPAAERAKALEKARIANMTHAQYVVSYIVAVAKSFVSLFGF